MVNKIVNFDPVVKKYESKKIIPKSKYSPKQPFRAVLSGMSSSGKTNFLLNMIFNELSFDKIIIYSPSIYQSKYKFLVDKFNDIYEKQQEMLVKMLEKEEAVQDKRKKKNRTKLDVIEKRLNGLDRILEVYDDPKSIKDVEDYEDDKVYIIIYDDLMVCSRKAMDTMSMMWSRGRHKNLSLFFLTQSFCNISTIIRKNSNIFSFHGVPLPLDIAIIHNRLPIKLDKETFEKIWLDSIKETHDFIYIDINNIHNMIRRNFYENIKELQKHITGSVEIENEVVN